LKLVKAHNDSRLLSNVDSVTTKVLMIDSDEILAGLIEKEFEQLEQFEFSREENAKIGLSLAKNHKPDIIIIDPISGGISGEEFFAKVKQSNSLQDAKILVLSKKINDEQVRRFEKLGVDDFIEKPFEVSELLFRLNKLQE
jgi:DNA-binding response OmpR family regulator